MAKAASLAALAASNIDEDSMSADEEDISPEKLEKASAE